MWGADFPGLMEELARKKQYMLTPEALQGIAQRQETGEGNFDFQKTVSYVRDIVRKTLGWSREGENGDTSPGAYLAAISAAKNRGISDARAYRAWAHAEKDVAQVFSSVILEEVVQLARLR